MTELSKKRNKNVLITFIALIVFCALSSLMSCTNEISYTYNKPTIEEYMVATNPDSLLIRSCIIQDDKVIILGQKVPVAVLGSKTSSSIEYVDVLPMTVTNNDVGESIFLFLLLLFLFVGIFGLISFLID